MVAMASFLRTPFAFGILLGQALPVAMAILDTRWTLTELAVPNEGGTGYEMVDVTSNPNFMGILQFSDGECWKDSTLGFVPCKELYANFHPCLSYIDRMIWETTSTNVSESTEGQISIRQSDECPECTTIQEGIDGCIERIQDYENFDGDLQQVKRLSEAFVEDVFKTQQFFLKDQETRLELLDNFGFGDSLMILETCNNTVLHGTSWDPIWVVDYDGQVVHPLELVPKESVSINFEDCRVGFYAGCNGHGGDYKVVASDDNGTTYSIAIFDLFSTAMACEGSSLVIEGLLSYALLSSSTFEVVDLNGEERLVFMDENEQKVLELVENDSVDGALAFSNGQPGAESDDASTSSIDVGSGHAWLLIRSFNFFLLQWVSF